jgi:hypothetical protein
MRVKAGVVLAILLTCPSLSGAQTQAGSIFGEPPPPPGPPRAFLDVNLIGFSGSESGSRVFRSRFLIFGEAGATQATYPKPSFTTSIPSFDIGGGYITGSVLGLGVNVSRTTYKDTASLLAAIPHPVYLNFAASATGVTGRVLTRRETAISAYVTAVPVRTSRAELRFFLGPTYYRINAEMVDAVTYTQSSSVTPAANAITVTAFTSSDVKGGGLGFHMGADFTYFFTKMIGVKGGFRYQSAQVSVKYEPLSKLEQDLRAGGPTISLGARFRFGK